VVDEPVDHRGGDDLVAEDLAPARERAGAQTQSSCKRAELGPTGITVASAG
jgi:hypothetical protein